MTSKKDLNAEISQRDQQIEVLVSRLQTLWIDKSRLEMLVMEMLDKLAEREDEIPTFRLSDPEASNSLQKTKKIDIQFVESEESAIVNPDGSPRRSNPGVVVRLKDRPAARAASVGSVIQIGSAPKKEKK